MSGRDTFTALDVLVKFTVVLADDAYSADVGSVIRSAVERALRDAIPSHKATFTDAKVTTTRQSLEVAR